MIQLIKAEYFKLWKSKSLWGVVALAFVPFVFAVLVFLDLGALNIEKGAFSIVDYASNLWQFTIGTSLSIILFAYLSASLGQEVHNGNMVYQLTRTGNRKKIVVAKVWTILSLNMTYFLLFLLVGTVSYLVFVHNGAYGSQTIWDFSAQQGLLISLAGLLVQIGFSLLSLCLSLYMPMIGLVMVTFVGTLLFSFLSSMENIGLYIPGSIFYNAYSMSDEQFYLVLMCQTGVMAVFSILLTFFAMKSFSSKNL